MHARSGAILAGLFTLGALLRFAWIGQRSVFIDEAYIAWLSLHRWPDLFALLRVAEFHPPLHYVLMKAWISLAGPGETALRMPSAVFGSVSIVLTYFLVRRAASEAIALMTAFLVAVSPFEIIVAQDGKMYTLLEVLTIAATLALAGALDKSAVRQSAVRRWTAYTILAAAILYTHYLGVFVLAAQGIWVLCRHRATVRYWFAAMVGAGILFAPWVPSLLVQLRHAADQSGGWGEPGLFWNLEGLIALFAFGGSLLGSPGFFYMNTSLSPITFLALVLPFLIVLAFGVFAMRRSRDALFQFGLPLAVVIGCAGLLSVKKSLFLPRWFSFLFPFYAVLVASGIVAIGECFGKYRQAAASLIIVGLLAYSVPVLDRLYFDPSFADRWRDAAAIVAQQYRPGDLMLYGEPQAELTFTYYFGGGHPGMILAIGRRYLGGAVPPPRLAGTPGAPVPLSMLARRYRRIWLVVAPPFRPDELNRTFAALRGSMALVSETRFPSAGPAGVYPLVYLFVSHTAPPQ